MVAPVWEIKCSNPLLIMVCHLSPPFQLHPPESVASKRQGNRTSYGSIMDDEGRRSSTEYDRQSSSKDSLFDRTGDRSSAMTTYTRLKEIYCQFRPLSMLSVVSVHSPNKDDDITIRVRMSALKAIYGPLLTITFSQMLGGGHVRRRSVASVIEASPSVPFEKRKHTACDGSHRK